MPNITYRHTHSVEEGEARRRLRGLIDRMAEKFRFRTSWIAEDQVKVSGRGVAGNVQLQPGQVLFDLDLTFLLSPFKARIESEIAKAMARELP